MAPWPIAPSSRSIPPRSHGFGDGGTSCFPGRHPGTGLAAFRLCLLAAFLLVPVHASGAILYVPDEYPTIEGGLDAAVNGDLVMVAPGTYFETIAFPAKVITLQSMEGAESTVIDGNLAGTVISFVGVWNRPKIDGFTIQFGFAFEGGGIYCFSHSSPEIRNCILVDNFASYGGGIAGHQYASPKITNCVFSRNEAIIYGGGVDLYFDSYPIFTNCTFTENSAPFAGGFYASIESSAVVEHCTFTKNVATGPIGGGGFVVYWNADVKIVNSIIWGNSATVGAGPDFLNYFGSADPEIRYTDVGGGWEGEGNIDEDPLFVGDGDYHLLAGSPCIDTGTDKKVHVDSDGDERPFLSGFDMGVDEYVGECWDDDGDRYRSAQCGGGDCDDDDPLVNPESGEIEDDGIDNDCDGFVDELNYGDLAPLGVGDTRVVGPDVLLAAKGLSAEVSLTSTDTDLFDLAPFVICDETSLPLRIAPEPDGLLNYEDTAVILHAASGYLQIVPACPD